MQFFVLGAGLFVMAHAAEERQANAQREIVVDGGLVDRLSKLYELQTGSQPSKPRLNKLIDDYVREEILFREALKMGLDRDDEIIRRRLTQKLDFLQRDLLAIADPAEEALKRFYEEHAERFREPARVSFSHVYFSPDRDGAAGARKRAEQALAGLNARQVERAPEWGDRFPLQYDYADLKSTEAAQVFGGSPLLDALFTALTGQWVGPFESGYGSHLLFISRRKEAAVPAFESVRDRVKDAFLEDARREGNEKKFEEIRKAYTVNYAYAGEAQTP